MKEYPLGTDEIIRRRQYKKYKSIKIVRKKGDYANVDLIALEINKKLFVLETPIDYLKFFILQETWKEDLELNINYMFRHLVVIPHHADKGSTKYHGIILAIDGSPQKAVIYLDIYADNVGAINLRTFKEIKNHYFIERIIKTLSYIDLANYIRHFRMDAIFLDDMFTNNFKYYYPLSADLYNPYYNENESDTKTYNKDNFNIEKRKDGSYLVPKPRNN